MKRNSLEPLSVPCHKVEASFCLLSPWASHALLLVGKFSEMGHMVCEIDQFGRHKAGFLLLLLLFNSKGLAMLEIMHLWAVNLHCH